MKIDRPIFIVGAGRSGSTVFLSVLAEHPNVAWLSKLCNWFPGVPAANRALMRTLDLPVVGKLAGRSIEPHECYPFWDSLYGGFSVPIRDLVADDVTEVVRKRITRVVSRLLTERRSRLLCKITGWPRLGFLQDLFPDARFVHLYRDGRAVANSSLEVDFWWGWRGPDNWRWGKLTPEQRDEWEMHGRSFVALAAIEWKILMEAMETAKQSIRPDSLLELQYEDFTADPIQTMRTTAQFCGLEWSPRFERSIARHTLRPANHKWKEELSARHQGILNSILCDSLARYGYRSSTDAVGPSASGAAVARSKARSSSRPTAREGS